MPHNVHIAECAALFPLQNLVKRTLKRRDREHFMRQGCICKIDGIFQIYAAVVWADIQVCNRLWRLLHRQGGNKRTAADARICHLLAFQMFIRRNDGCGVHTSLPRQFADRRELSVRRQMPVRNQPRNAVCQLLVERRGGFAFIQFHTKNVVHRFPLYFFFL